MRRRMPAVAGLFYPDDPDDIRTFLRPFAKSVDAERRVRFVLGPHAGYAYSGAIAGDAYAAARVPDRVVLLGPNHSGFGDAQAVYATGSFVMPMGEVPIDEELARRLTEHMGLVDDERAHRQEHSLEVHVPFLQAKNANVRIVPICLGHLPFSACERMGLGLARVLREEDDVLVVVSTDMSHYVSAAEAARLDRLALDRVAAVDARGLFDTVRTHRISMCGVIPTTVALVAAGELGLRTSELVRYGTSGDQSGDYRRVVGYASALVP